MSNEIGQKILNQIVDDYKHNRLILPSIPDIALRVRRAVSDSGKSAKQIAQIIKIDPALTARLIQIVNGPMSRGNSQISDLHNAISRLGFRVTQNLVMSITFRNMFKAKSPAVRMKMQELWKQTSRVGAISYVLARMCPGLEQDRAMIAGIVSNIGMLPVLRYADEYPELLKIPGELDELLNRLKAPIGSMILRSWNFDADISEVPNAIKDFHRDSGEKIDYSDVVIVATVHSYFGKKEGGEDIPPLSILPAFKKMPLSEEGPEASIELLKNAQEEINTMIKILAG